MTQRIWIRNPLAVFTANDLNAGGGVVVEGNRIVEIVPSGGTPEHPYSTQFDAGRHVVTPGLINTHHHWYQTLTRAWGPVANVPLFPWLTTLYPAWARLTPRAHAAASRVAIAELLLSGCTTASDHHYLFPAGLEEATDIQVEAVRELSFRATITRGSMSLGEDDGGLPPRATIQTEDAIMADCERVVDAYHDPAEGAMVQIALAPCSPFSVSTDLMRASAELARRRDLRLHTHLAETIDEEDFCRERFGLRTVDYLESVGWLGDRTWVAHGIHFDDDEVRRLAAAGTGVSHCPSSNMRLSSGICRAVELEDAGAPVGLGVDGSASNDCSNLIQEARQALLLQRLRYGADITTERALGWATKGSARLLGRDDIGEIAVGKQADLAMFTLEELRFSGSHDPLAALLLCGADRADRVMVAGEWRVVDGAIVDLDLDALMAEHRELAAALVAS